MWAQGIACTFVDMDDDDVFDHRTFARYPNVNYPDPLPVLEYGKMLEKKDVMIQGQLWLKEKYSCGWQRWTLDEIYFTLSCCYVLISNIHTLYSELLHSKDASGDNLPPQAPPDLLGEEGISSHEVL